MDLLKKIPIAYRGDLHQIHLVNFSVELAEVESLVPKPLRPRLIHERAMISMVNVQLRRMRPAFLPSVFHFNYQHVGFRLLIQDAAYNEDHSHKGIFFLDSFTNRPSIALGGKLFTDYRLRLAEIWNHKQDLDLRCGNHILSYGIDQVHPPDQLNEELHTLIGKIDRAYSILGSEVRRTRILREKWPLQQVRCTHFRTNFFQTARLEGIFSVPEVIPYTWLPPKAVLPLPQPIPDTPVFV